MSVKIAKPSIQLQPFIKQYWCIENVLPQGEKHVQRIIPSGLAELSLYTGKRPQIIGGRKDLEDNFNLSGHQNEFYDLQVEKELSIFSVVFQPQGLMKFFNFPLNEIYNQNIPLKLINKKLEHDILSQLTDAQSFEKKTQIVESYFTDILKNEYHHYDFQRINQAIINIGKTFGNITIEKLAAESCLSRKQFERKFSELIGITPKQYLKIIRLQYALYLRSRNNRLNITDLAHESGYYDQAHFINDFKQLTGFTPKHYFDNTVAYSDFFE